MRLLTLGAIGAAIFGVSRGMRNGTFKRLAQNMPKGQNLKQMMKPMQDMANTTFTEKQPKQQGF